MAVTFLTNFFSGTGFSTRRQCSSRRQTFKKFTLSCTICTSTNLSFVYIGAWYIGTGRSAAVNVRQSLGQRQGGGWTTLKRSHHLKNIPLCSVSREKKRALPNCSRMTSRTFTSVEFQSSLQVYRFSVCKKVQLRSWVGWIFKYSPNILIRQLKIILVTNTRV